MKKYHFWTIIPLETTRNYHYRYAYHQWHFQYHSISAALTGSIHSCIHPTIPAVHLSALCASACIMQACRLLSLTKEFVHWRKYRLFDKKERGSRSNVTSLTRLHGHVPTSVLSIKHPSFCLNFPIPIAPPPFISPIPVQFLFCLLHVYNDSVKYREAQYIKLTDIFKLR